jgi:hypothetical protein
VRHPFEPVVEQIAASRVGGEHAADGRGKVFITGSLGADDPLARAWLDFEQLLEDLRGALPPGGIEWRPTFSQSASSGGRKRTSDSVRESAGAQADDPGLD